MSEKLLRLLKFNLLTVNFFFVIMGVVILSVGLSVKGAYDTYYMFWPLRFLLPGFCIGTGVVIFVVAAVGIYGALAQIQLINTAFAGAMILMLAFPLSASIAGLTLQNSILEIIQAQLQWGMDLYGPSKNYEATRLWDTIQEDFQCCGVENAAEWLTVLGTQQSLEVPLSCCSQGSFSCTLAAAHTAGCGNLFADFVSSHLNYVRVAGAFLTLMQSLIVVSVVTALWMVKVAREERDKFIPTRQHTTTINATQQQGR